MVNSNWCTHTCKCTHAHACTRRASKYQPERILSKCKHVYITCFFLFFYCTFIAWLLTAMFSLSIYLSMFLNWTQPVVGCFFFSIFHYCIPGLPSKMGNKCFPEGKLLLVHLFAGVCDLSCPVLPATVSPELMSRCVKHLICWHCMIISLNMQVSKQAKFQNVKTKKACGNLSQLDSRKNWAKDWKGRKWFSWHLGLIGRLVTGMHQSAGRRWTTPSRFLQSIMIFKMYIRKTCH